MAVERRPLYYTLGNHMHWVDEELDFCPQLPQILRDAGYEYASLFFQWTWHTPIVPQEQVPAIWWEGLDGSRLLTSSRNALNLHQWPEDFAGLLESPLLREMPVPGIVQWLELMPSPADAHRCRRRSKEGHAVCQPPATAVKM